MKKLYCFLERICSNRWFPLLFIPIAVCFLLLYSATTSPLYLDEGCDSVIFKTMGLAILQGKIPYVDIFDHKGPVLYLINAMGQWMIPGRYGIFAFQVFSLSMALFFLFKISRLFLKGFLSFVWLIVSLCILGVFFEGGNLTEEWNLPYLVIPLYYAMAYFSKNTEQRFPIYYCLIFGLCFGIAFFIRPNDAVAQIGGVMVGIAMWLMYKKQYGSLLRGIVYFALGFVIIAFPIVAWFGINGALGDLYYGLLQFNAKYSEGILSLVLSAFGKTKVKFFIFFVVFAVMVYNTSFKRLLVLLIPILAFVVVLIGKMSFPHYYIVVVPYFMLFFVFLCLQRNKSIIICSISVMLASHIDTLKTARKTPKPKIEYAFNVIKNGLERSAFFEETDALLRFIPDKERDQIWNYNLDFNLAMLWHNGLVQTNKVPLFSMYQVDNKLKEEDDIIKKRPEYVLLSEEHSKDSSDYAFILTNYDMIAQTDTTICKIKLFHKK